MKAIRTMFGKIFGRKEKEPATPALHDASVVDWLGQKKKTAGDGVHTRKTRDTRPPAVREFQRTMNAELKKAHS